MPAYGCRRYRPCLAPPRLAEWGMAVTARRRHFGEQCYVITANAAA